MTPTDDLEREVRELLCLPCDHRPGYGHFCDRCERYIGKEHVNRILALVRREAEKAIKRRIRALLPPEKETT